MNRKQYIRQLAKQITDEVIQANGPLIRRVINEEVDKIKAKLASLAPNAAERSKMLAIMGSSGALGVYLANVDQLAGNSERIATTPNRAPTAQEYFGEDLDEFTKTYFDGDPVVNAAIDEFFNGPKEFRDQLDNYFYMGE